MTVLPNAWRFASDPLPVGELVRTVLHEHRHVVFAVGRHGRIDLRGDQHVDVGRARPAALLPVIVGALHHLDGVGDMHVAARTGRALREWPGNRGSPSRAMLSLPEEPRILKLRTCSTNSMRQVLGVHRLEEGTPHIEVGHHDLARGSPRRPSSATPVARPFRTRICVNGRAAADRAAAGLQRGRQRLGDRAHAATRKTPGANRAVDAAHVVMQQHIRRTRRARARAPCR